MKCQNDKCIREARYGIYRTFEDGTKKFIKVCPACESNIAKENVRRLKENEPTRH